MSYPDWVLKHKQKNTEIRKISNNYYLYKITSKWDPKKKRTKKVTLGLIGSIKEDGIRYTKDRKKERAEKNTYSVLEYGASEILIQLGEDIRNNLKKIFGEEGDVLYVISIIRLIESCPLKSLKDVYSSSYLCQKYKNLKIGSNQLTNLLKNIGTKRDLIIKFFKKNITKETQILFDATSIASKSSNLGINEKGYSNNFGFKSQVNLLYMFSKQTNQPLYYRIVPGNIKEVSALKNCIKEFKVEQSILIADKGFVSKSNIEELEKDDLKYVLPMKRNHSIINYRELERSGYDKYDGHFMYKKRAIWYKNQETIKGLRLISYYDGNLAERERQDFLMRIEKEIEGYNIESFKEKERKFGYISMQTNLGSEVTEDEIFKIYKGRSEIEQLFDVLKNTLEADRSYMRGDKEMETWFLINHISMMLYYRLYEILKNSNLLKNYSPLDIMRYGKQIRKIKIKNVWFTSEINSKIKTFLKKCNLAVT